MKIVKIDQLDGTVEELIIRNVNKETCEVILWLLGLEFNKVTGYWHAENEMVGLEDEKMNMENLNKRLANILNNQEKIKADIEELNRHVEELKQEELEQEKTPLGWIPEEGEYYFYVNIYGNIEATTNDKTRIDRKLIKHTRVFKTREEAEFEAERMKVLRELEKFACEFEINERDWYLYYDYVLQKISIGISGFKCHELYFESEEMVKEAIENVGEDRVKRYYLGVTN